MLIETPDQYDPERLRDYDRPAPAAACLVATPAHFQVLETQNPHMQGRAGTVDPVRAAAEWKGLVEALREVPLQVHEIAPEAGLSDLCFTANPSLAGLDREGVPFAVLGRMRHASRGREPAVHGAWYRGRGVRVVDPWEAGGDGGSLVWEGAGDALWHPDRFQIWAGHGQRSDAEAHRRVSAVLGVPVVLLRLVDPAYYHLDTCLVLLDQRTALWVPRAFDPVAQALLGRAFERLIEVDPAEAHGRLAGNAYCPDRRQVLLPPGAPRTRSRLEDAGFFGREVELDEFLKSGGSVYCLKQELPAGF